MQVTGEQFLSFLDHWGTAPIGRDMVFDIDPAARAAGLVDGDGTWKLSPDTTYDLDTLGSLRCTTIKRLFIDTAGIVKGWLDYIERHEAKSRPDAPAAPAVEVEVQSSPSDGITGDAPAPAEAPLAVEPEKAVATPVASGRSLSDAVRDYVAAHPGGCRGADILDHLQAHEGVADRTKAQAAVSRARKLGLIQPDEEKLWVLPA
jgi:hypothetical protein